MDFFKKYDSYDYLRNIEINMRKEIANMSDKEITQSNLEEWVDYLESKYQIEPIVLFEDSVETNLDTDKIKQYNHFRFEDEPEYYNVDGYNITFRIYYDGNPILFDVRPSHYLLSSFPSSDFKKPYGESCGYFSLSFSYTRGELDGKDDVSTFIQERFENTFNNYKKMIEYINNDVNSFNSTLRKIAENELNVRKEKASSFAQLSKKLEIPLKTSNNAPNTKPIPLSRVNRKPPTKPVGKTSPEEYHISDSDYQNINNIINMNGTTMEKTARTYFRNNEEELRDHLIATLNTHYDNATGETFRKIGKTDILIEFENKAGFICECKIWHGNKSFDDTVQQLLNYSTWKDTKVSIVIFNKTVKTFSSIIQTLESWVKKNTKSSSKIQENIWQCKYYRKDMEIDIDLNISIFDLYVDETQFKDSQKSKIL